MPSPLGWMEPPDAHLDFWQAVQRTHIELEGDGLYLTHLFREIDVILQPDWLTRRVRLDLGFAKLSVFRPASIDLVLTKMVRGDEDDLQDIQFLLRRDPQTPDELVKAFALARVPEVPEIQALFSRAKSRVLAGAAT